MQHLFNDWGRIASTLKGKCLFLFLDFDGTLSPIADTPAKASLPRKARFLLRRISRQEDVAIALISGRGLADIRGKVGLEGIIYSGNHGLEVEGPGLRFKFPVLTVYGRALKKIKKSLASLVVRFKGALLEDKGLTLSLHYRLVEKRQAARLKTIFNKVVSPYLSESRIKVISGKKVLEVKPPAEWGKGKVLLWLLKRQAFHCRRKPVLPIYIGDDITDEDAFRALGRNGLSVFVGSPRRSAAKYYLRNPAEVERFLRKIAEITGYGSAE